MKKCCKTTSKGGATKYNIHSPIEPKQSTSSLKVVLFLHVKIAEEKYLHISHFSQTPKYTHIYNGCMPLLNYVIILHAGRISSVTRIRIQLAISLVDDEVYFST